MSIYNLRRVATSTTGTGTITLGSAVTGFKAFSAAPAIPDQTVVTYAIADTANSEIGWGLYTVSGSTLTRNVIESTNSNTAISLTGNAQVFLTSSAGDLQSNTAFPNRIRNGGMDIWQRGTASITVTTAGAYTADGWIVVPTGASATAIQATGRSLTVNSLKVTGAASVTDVVIKQRIESYISAAMTSQQVTFQAWVYNNTGGSITPTITVKHPTASDNYASTATDVSAVSLQACGNTAWTLVSYTFAASSSSNLGMEVSVDFGNNFTTTGKSVQFTEVDLRVTPGIPTGLNYAPPVSQFRPIHEELIFCQRYLSKSYNQGVLPGTSVTAGTGAILFQPTGTASNLSIFVRFPVVMRIAPSFNTYDNAGTANDLSYYSAGWQNGQAATLPYTLDGGAGVQDLSGAHTTINFDWSAGAEL